MTTDEKQRAEPPQTLDDKHAVDHLIGLASRACAYCPVDLMKAIFSHTHFIHTQRTIDPAQTEVEWLDQVIADVRAIARHALVNEHNVPGAHESLRAIISRTSGTQRTRDPLPTRAGTATVTGVSGSGASSQTITHEMIDNDACAFVPASPERMKAIFGEAAAPPKEIPRRESPRLLGQVLTTPSSNCIHVSPYDVHARFKPGMDLVFASPGDVRPKAYRSGVARVAGTGKTELAFMVPLNTLVPGVAVGDNIYEYEVPCTRCRCKSCEPTPPESVEK